MELFGRGKIFRFRIVHPFPYSSDTRQILWNSFGGKREGNSYRKSQQPIIPLIYTDIYILIKILMVRLKNIRILNSFWPIWRFYLKFSGCVLVPISQR